MRDNPDFAQWLGAHSKLVQSLLMLARSAEWILCAFLLGQPQSVSEFAERVGVSRRPTLPGWFAAWAAVAIGALALLGSAIGWIPPNPATRAFHLGGGVSKSFIIAFGVFVAPFFEEIVMRGFLYRAFRGSFGVLPSTILVLCVHAYFHWGLITRAAFTFVCLVSVEVLLCCVRERTASTWNCVVRHAAYNAAGGLPWFVCPIALLLLLPCFRSQTGAGNWGRPAGATNSQPKRQISPTPRPPSER